MFFLGHIFFSAEMLPMKFCNVVGVNEYIKRSKIDRHDGNYKSYYYFWTAMTGCV